TGEPKLACNAHDLVSRRPRTGGAHIRDDGHAALAAGGQERAHAIAEQGIESRLRIAKARQLRQADGPFGEALEDEIVDIAAVGELDGRFDPIARVAGPASDSDRLHDANTPKAMHAAVITIDAPKSHGNEKR